MMIVHRCRWKKKVRYLLLMLLIFFISCPAYSASLKLKHEDFVVASKSSNWCGSVVHLEIEASWPGKIFDPPDSAFLQINMLGKVRAIASFNCPNIEKFVFTGWSSGKLYYAAVALKKGGWQLKGLYAPP
jgi:hypothetical protein